MIVIVFWTFKQMWPQIFIISSIIYRIEADVSHLKSLTKNNHFSAFNGYYYNPPAQQLPSPAPPPPPQLPPSTTFLPEIIVNKGKNKQKRKFHGVSFLIEVIIE